MAVLVAAAVLVVAVGGAVLWSSSHGDAPPRSGTTTATPPGPAPRPSASAPVQSPGGAAALPAATRVVCPPPTTTVGDADELKAALAAAAPGDVIALRDGSYRGHFVAGTSGTAEQPVWLCGGPAAVLDGGGTDSGYGLHLDGAQYWRLVGFTVRNAQKGVVADGTRGTVLQSLTVEQIGDEGIHLRAGSTGNAVLDSTVRGTGLHEAKFGEGLYVGSAVSNWDRYSGGGPDRSDNNLLARNRISATTSESVDIKEGTTGGVLAENTLDGAGMTAADSWVDVKGNGWTITGNSGRNTPLDGFQTHSVADGWGNGNTFRSNTALVSGPGVGFHLAPALDNVVACDNSSGSGTPATSTPTCRA